MPTRPPKASGARRRTISVSRISGRYSAASFSRRPNRETTRSPTTNAATSVLKRGGGCADADTAIYLTLRLDSAREQTATFSARFIRSLCVFSRAVAANSVREAAIAAPTSATPEARLSAQSTTATGSDTGRPAEPSTFRRSGSEPSDAATPERYRRCSEGTPRTP